MQFKYIVAPTIGIILLVLGTIGIVIPILPTTPFFIGAVACFSGMPKLRKWIISRPIFGEYIVNYKDRKGLKFKTVMFSMVFLWTMLLISCFLVKSLIMTILLLLIGIAVSVHILYMRKPIKEELRKDRKQQN